MTAIVRGMNTIRISFTILGQCVSSKNRRQIVKRGPQYFLAKSKEAQRYEESARLQIPADARQMLECRVRATVRLFYSSERPDLDAELLFDCLSPKYEKRKGRMIRLGDGEYGYAKGERVMVQKGVYVNDRQIREKHIYHAIDRANPRAEIEIEPMDMIQAPLLIDEPQETEDEAEAPF